MIVEKRFFELGVNSDDDYKAVLNGFYLNMENCRIGISGLSKSLAINNLPSTSLLYDIQLPYDNLTIGTAVDYARERLIWFVHNSNGLDSIYAYDFSINDTYIVLLSSQTEEGLNFSKSFRIDRNVRVAGDLLLWADNNNEPQCINIEAGIKLNQPSYVTNVDPYATNIPYTTLTLIKRPPIYPIQATKSTDGGFDKNYITNNAYQFYARYQYKNYQYSAMSAFSNLIPYNAAGETNNYIIVQFSFSEHIDDYVQAVDFCVRYGNTGKSFIIRTYDKSYYYDRVAIEDHNSGTTQLGFAFYDNIFGIALDDITANTAFDDVALTAKTLELAKNRCFLANLLKGYDAPTFSSLNVSLTTINTGAGGSFNGDWGYVTLHANLTGGCQDEFMYPFVKFDVSAGAPYLFYYFSSVRNSTIWNGGVGTVPGTINLNEATFKGNTEADLITFLKATQYPYNFGTGCGIGSPVWQTSYDISYASLGAVTGYLYQPVSVNQFFKSNSDYELNIEFKDRFSRRCGVLKTGVTFTIPARTYGQTDFTTAIQWTLNNNDTLEEIPDWAHYYQMVIKKNQTTRFFEQIRATGVQYVDRAQDGTYTYGNIYTFGTTYALGIDLSALTNYGLGYTFNEGDFARIILSDDTNYDLPVLSQDGNFVLLQPVDIGTVATTDIVLIELYTPYRASVTEPFYETGNVYAITKPETTERAYSVLTDTISGDTYAIQRTDSGSDDYIVEAMSPNDKIWQIWQTNTGFINFFDTIGQQQKVTTIDWSDVYVNGTKTNGLNKFQPLNTKDIGNSSGEITKLQLTNKMQELGTVMLVICTQETQSAYLQEVQLYAAVQAGDIATTDAVIGTINPLKNRRGTINPESVVEYSGTVFFFDALNGKYAQYSNEGITDVSEYKMRRFWDRFGKRYVEQGSTVIEGFCGFSYISSCVDPSTSELLITIPQVEENTVTSGLPVGFAPALPSYSTLPTYATSVQNRFDIYDGQPKTMIFKWEQNKWNGAYQWLPDMFEYFGNKLVGFKNGLLYLFNENTSNYNTIFGVQYPQRICFPCVLNPSILKDLYDMAIEGKQIPVFSVAYVEYPDEQITDLSGTDTDINGNLLWQNKEGVMYATWLRDRLSPNVSGTPDQNIFTGDELKSFTPLIMLEFQTYDEQLNFNFVNIGFAISKGQTNILQQPKP